MSRILNLQTIANLSILYTQPHRHYHNLEHINKCLGELESIKNINISSDIEFFEGLTDAIWFHDAIYNPFSDYNEEDSSTLYIKSVSNSYKCLSHWELLVVQAILSTKSHYLFSNTLDSSNDERDLFIKTLLDIDLSSLGKDYDEFRINGENIRKEFYFVPEEIFNKNRIKFFENILARKKIYYTPFFFEKYESKARHNIKISLKELTK